MWWELGGLESAGWLVGPGRVSSSQQLEQFGPDDWCLGSPHLSAAEARRAGECCVRAWELGTPHLSCRMAVTMEYFDVIVWHCNGNSSLL